MRAAVVLSVLLLWGGGLAQKIGFRSAGKSEVVEKADHAPPSNQERARRIRTWLQEAGCNGAALRTTPVNGDGPNIVCELPGKSADRIVVGAHYDLPSSPARPFDDWSGAALLPSLFQCVNDRKRRHTIVFVAFADHGNNVSGAEEFAAHETSEHGPPVRTMVNLDALGLSPTKVWTSHSDKHLLQAFMDLVYVLKLPASQVDIDAAGNTDSEPFATRNIPQITIHSLTRQNLLSRAENQLNPDNYYKSYRLLCGYIAALDGSVKLKHSSH
jgi:hypothetical protein